MEKFALLALVLVGCDAPLTVPAPDAGRAADTDPGVCCTYYEATTEWQTCWGCGTVVYCVGVPCPEGVVLCQAGAGSGPGEGAPSYPVGGIACGE